MAIFTQQFQLILLVLLINTLNIIGQFKIFTKYIHITTTMKIAKPDDSYKIKASLPTKKKKTHHSPPTKKTNSSSIPPPSTVNLHPSTDQILDPDPSSSRTHPQQTPGGRGSSVRRPLRGWSGRPLKIKRSGAGDIVGETRLGPGPPPSGSAPVGPHTGIRGRLLNLALRLF